MIKTIEKLNNGESVNIVAFGDSITEVDRTPGYFGGATAKSKNWAQQLKKMLIVGAEAKKLWNNFTISPVTVKYIYEFFCEFFLLLSLRILHFVPSTSEFL